MSETKEEIDDLTQQLNSMGDFSIPSMISQINRDYGWDNRETSRACDLAHELYDLQLRYIEELEARITELESASQTEHQENLDEAE